MGLHARCFRPVSLRYFTVAHVDTAAATSVTAPRTSEAIDSPDTSWDDRPGDHLIIPSTRHGLHAVDDCVVLLTVAKSVQR